MSNLIKEIARNTITDATTEWLKSVIIHYIDEVTITDIVDFLLSIDFYLHEILKLIFI